MTQTFTVIAVLACLLISPIYSSSLVFADDELKEATFAVDTLAGTVVFISAVKPDPTKGDGATNETGGTGFIVRHNDRAYIVTANHIISNSLEVKILANQRTGSVAWVPLSQIQAGSPGSSWIVHPTSDLVILPFSPPSLGSDFVGMWIFGMTLYEGKAHLLDRLIAIGFPYTIGSDVTSEQLSPVVKETRLVSWPASRIFKVENSIYSESNLLVDPPLFPGFSGGPVYSLDEPPGLSQFRSKRTTLVGIYVGELLDKKGVAFLGRVVPAKNLIDLLNSEPVKAYEKNSNPLPPLPSLEDKTGP